VQLCSSGARPKTSEVSQFFPLAISRQAIEFVHVAATICCVRARSRCSLLRQGQLQHARLKEAKEGNGCVFLVLRRLSAREMLVSWFVARSSY